MFWGFEMRYFNIKKELMGYSSNKNNKIEFSTITSEIKTHNSTTFRKLDSFLSSDSKIHDLKEEPKKELWAQFVKEEILNKEPFFLQIIKGLNGIFYEKYHKISPNQENSTYYKILKEFEKLKEFLFELIITFYKDFLNRTLLKFKEIVQHYEEIRNILDEIFFSKEFSFYSILMRTIDISSKDKQIDLEFELSNSLNIDLAFLDLDPNFKKYFTEKIYEDCIEILREMKTFSTPKAKYDQISFLKEFLIQEVFDKYNKENLSMMRIEPDQIISLFVCIICGMKEPELINEMIFMEELLSYRCKENYSNSYFYISFKTAVHYLLKKARQNLKRYEKYGSNESVFRV